MRRIAFYSAWWLAGAPLTSPEWAARDAAEAQLVHSAEALDLGAWLSLSEHERADVVEAYAHRRPELRRVAV